MGLKIAITVAALSLGAIYALPKKPHNDPLLNVYSELKVGMTLPEIANLTGKHCPRCTMKDMEFIDHGHGNDSGLEIFNWYLGIDPIEFIFDSEQMMIHRIFLRIDIDKSNLKLVDAVYCRYLDPRQIKNNVQKASSDRRVLVGTGHYDH